MTFPGEGTPSPVFHNIEDQMSKVYVTGVAEVHHPNGKVFKKNRVIPEKEFAVFPPEHRKMLQDKGIVADVSEHVALLTDTVPDNSPTAQTEDEIEALRRELENEKARRQEQSDLPDLPSLSRGTWTVDQASWKARPWSSST